WPVDSTMYATAGFSGYAWRDSLGQYAYVEAGASLAPDNASVCAAANVTVLPQGRVVAVQPGLPAGIPSATLIGTPVFLVQRVTYEFKRSVALLGRMALWRTIVPTGQSDELVAPFVTAATFRFFVAGSDRARRDGPGAVHRAPRLVRLQRGAARRDGVDADRADRRIRRRGAAATARRRDGPALGICRAVARREHRPGAARHACGRAYCRRVRGLAAGDDKHTVQLDEPERLAQEWRVLDGGRRHGWVRPTTRGRRCGGADDPGVYAERRRPRAPGESAGQGRRPYASGDGRFGQDRL